MIGYYVHHHGHGHLHRATSIARHLSASITGISSLSAPDDWRGDWLRLDRDDTSPQPHSDPRASGRLHWVPVAEPGLRSRMAALSQWLERAKPELLVVDVSVEVALLARLHGVMVVTVAMPGFRGDPAHRLGYDISSGLIGPWPHAAHDSIMSGLDAATMARIQPVGAISRYPVAQDVVSASPRSVAVLFGSGGVDEGADWIARAKATSPGWAWTVLGGTAGAWVTDPWNILRSASVVITHAGQNALAEVAAARRPAVVLPQQRPHDEQMTTARALGADPQWPAEVVTSPDTVQNWDRLLTHVASLDGGNWAAWCDGHAAQRAASAIEATLTGSRHVSSA